ncbi:MAG: thioredoxin family protein [bacterium]|nr:thioredoxin family protein [bacterium]
MARTESTMIMPLGTTAPDFQLPDVISGEVKALKELKSDKATVVMFICNHCPFVKHIRLELVKLTNEYIRLGISFVAINSNDVEKYPEDSPENMKAMAEEFGFQFPYLFDETQKVATAYYAACTPDFYIFDKQLKCVYRGQFDDSRPENRVSVTGRDIRDALNSILSGKPVDSNQKPSIGCNIKWKE